MKRWIRNSRIAGFALLLVTNPLAHAASFSVGQLMQQLAQQRQGAATFSEKKYLAILDQPLESSGELLFVAPSRLEKRTLKPKPEIMVLDGDTLTLERGRSKHQLQLRDYPEVAAMIESIRATLAGDRAALERVYRLTLNGRAERWTLALTPRDPNVAAIIARIDVSGTRDAVTQVDIFQADGDRAEMQIQKASPR